MSFKLGMRGKRVTESWERSVRDVWGLEESLFRPPLETGGSVVDMGGIGGHDGAILNYCRGEKN